MDKIMIRKLMDSEIRQKTSNGHLCVSDLSELYNRSRIKDKLPTKDFTHFFKNKSEIEYIIEILNLQGVFIERDFPRFMDELENKGVLQALKSIGEYQVTGRGDNRAIYCNPYVFVAIAQWLSPTFRAKVTMWVTDSLILNRIEAGHGFSRLTSAITEHIVPTLSDNGKRFIYSNFAKLLNIKVFGKHDSELRQLASKEQLAKMRDIETELATLIKVGHITTYQDAKEYLSK